MGTTRQSFVDAARKLFGQSGLKNTTMNDIAMESQKGRRTLYTYFRNKNELLDAVIEEELNFVISSLREVMQCEMDPIEKFVAYVVTRMNVVKIAVQRNGSLQADFFRDVIRVELVRRKLEKLEISFLEEILQEGCDQGLFNMNNVRQVAIFSHFVMRGIDVPYIRGMLDEKGVENEESLRRKTLTILQGLLKNDQ